MTVHARSDIAAVSISQQHGGCGEVHSRPVHGGAPVKVWALTCGQCETVLAKDSNWSVTLAELPETPDEIVLREDRAKRAEQDRLDNFNQLPEHLAKALAPLVAQIASAGYGSIPQAIAAMDRLCRNGHRNAADAKFCSSCGSSMAEGVPSDHAPDPAPEPELSATRPVLPDNIEDLPMPQLRALAAELGVATTRSKAEQVALIKEAVGG
jgi:hypothetical protein